MLIKNIRFYILVASVSISLITYFYVQSTYSSERLQTIRLTQIYALTAVSYLYTALLIGPLIYLLPSIPFKSQIQKSRRAIGVSAFCFAVLHSYFAFFKQLGGFEGLNFLTDKYLLAISLSFTALVILGFMAATSIDKIIARMKFRRWKVLHRLVYLGGFFILIHALMLGTHFADLSGTIPQIFSVCLAFLLLLESLRFDDYLARNFNVIPKLGIFTTVLSALFLSYLIFLAIPKNGPVSLGIHAQHIEIAKQSQLGIPSPSGFPGMSGDRSKRYSVSIDMPPKITAREETPLSFTVYDASNGNQVVSFSKMYEKLIHLIIVNRDLTFFDHVHPEPDGTGFKISYPFPENDSYRLYLDFQPTGAIEQQFAFNLPVGTPESQSKNEFKESDLSGVFGSYKVELQFNKPLKSSLISTGGQKLNFKISDTASGQPVTDLKPYLASYGHLVMINTQTFDYIHVHPTNTQTPKPDDTSGPDVEFMPLGLNGPIKPGLYKLFAQFNPRGELFTSNFVIRVE